ncbi:hypothetical protein CEXT_301411 [Caerostris extrusa]|uniref:Uncharacterized protein n=1 Tax=Caerostris extrusa TaxID=172846 RepID=A0AAV4X648_CAEEX|nr:hypothetical protein CEXT_301411 [Caerostris extrusa]
MPEPDDLSSTDSPLQKKRWWRRLSSARRADSADRGRSVSALPYNVPRQEPSPESDESGQEPTGWRARFVNSLQLPSDVWRQLMTN